MVRPPSKGRCRVEMALIADRTKRQVTFSKRRPTLFKACSDLALDCGPGARVAVIVFSEAGNAFALDCTDDPHDLEALEELRRAREAAAKQVEAEHGRMKLIGEKVVQAAALQGGTRRVWWEADPEALGPAELPVFARALRRLRDDVLRLADNLHAAAPAQAPAAAEDVAY